METKTTNEKKLYFSNYECRLMLAMAKLAEYAKNNGAILLCTNWSDEVKLIQERETGENIRVPEYVHVGTFCPGSIHFIYENKLFSLDVGDYHEVRLCCSPMLDSETYDSNTYGFNLYDELNVNIFDTFITWEKIKNFKPSLVLEKHRRYWASPDGRKGGYTMESSHEVRKRKLNFYRLEAK